MLYVFRYHGVKDIIHDRCSISLCSKQKSAFEQLCPTCGCSNRPIVHGASCSPLCCSFSFLFLHNFTSSCVFSEKNRPKLCFIALISQIVRYFAQIMHFDTPKCCVVRFVRLSKYCVLNSPYIYCTCACARACICVCICACNHIDMQWMVII